MPIIVEPLDTIATTELRREVMLHLPGVLTPEVDYRLKQSVRDFCRITQVWQQRNTTLLTTVADQEEYAAGLDVGTELVAVISAWNGTTEIDVEVPGEVEDWEPGHTDSTWKIGTVGTDTLRLLPAPNASGTVIKGTVAFAPNEDATTLPLVVWQRWRTPIAHGAIAMLMLQVGKPWSNPAQAAYHQRCFDEGAMECASKTGPRRRRPLTVTPW